MCEETAELRVASIGAHFGEEPCFSGTRGSGTVFFTGCSSHCFFCQNWQISTGMTGEILSLEEAWTRIRAMLERGVHNLNFVSPDHFLPHIEEWVRRMRAEGRIVPVLFNLSGYQRPEWIARSADVADIFLPDMKFADAALADRCMGDRHYPDIAFAALSRMIEAKGFLHPFDPDGHATATGGVLVRHLVLPGEVPNSIRVIERLRREYGRFLPLSVMSQYHPVPACESRNDLNRRLTHEEYAEVKHCVESCGFEYVFVQEHRGDDNFMPDFEKPQPFSGNGPPTIRA